MRTHIGQYRIEAPLGRGGMGVVYRGVHENLGRPVAIKELAPELTQQPEFRDRFFSEAKTQARLHHPNIVSVYDLLEEQGEYFIVMELVPGDSLDDRLKACVGTGMGQGEAVSVFQQVLSALDYAHSEGVIHRDIKPSNVMITPEGRVKLMDFGIALLIGDKRLTASQSAIGTPTYMSPEQIVRPRSVDHRTDIYSAAVVFYEMLAGQPPFDDDTEYAIKKLHVEAPLPDLGALKPDLPAGLVAAVSKALSKDPDARYASAGELLRLLGDLPVALRTPGFTPLPAPILRPTTLERVPPAVAPFAPPPPRAGWLEGRNRWIALAAALVVAVGLGGGAFVFARKSAPSAETTPANVAGTETGGMAALPPPGGQVAEGTVTSAPLSSSLVPPSSESSSSLPAPAVVERPSPSKTAALPERSPRRGSGAAPGQPAAAPAESPVAAPPAPAAPPPQPADPEPEPQDSATGVERFQRMNDVVVNLQKLSKQAFEAYEEEEREDELYDQLRAFSKAASGVLAEFQKATGTGLRGLTQNLKGVFKRNQSGREADIKILETRAQDLIRRGGLVDHEIQATPPGPVTLQIWKEVQRNLKKLDGYV